MRSTHSDRLERWLGHDAVENVSLAMKDWYGPPVLVCGVPGRVYATSDGDFVGPIHAGQFLLGLDWAVMRLKRIMRNATRSQMSSANAGFASLSDIIFEATSGGKQRTYYWAKSLTYQANDSVQSSWRTADSPTAAANASNAPSGDAPTDATQGAYLIDNVSPDTRHVVSAHGSGQIAGHNYLLYDRIFQVNKTMNSVAAEAVTGVPTRYQSITSGDADYAGGNFLFVEVGTIALANTAHTWTSCTYLDQNGNASTLPDLIGIAACGTRRLDHPLHKWYAPLASGDVGVKTLTNMQCSATVATGQINFAIGHPLCWIPVPIVASLAMNDYINRPFGLPRVFDDAALAFLDAFMQSTSPNAVNLTVHTVAG